eukprot:2111125-Rhodomonas_salina.5
MLLSAYARAMRCVCCYGTDTAHVATRSSPDAHKRYKIRYHPTRLLRDVRIYFQYYAPLSAYAHATRSPVTLLTWDNVLPGLGVVSVTTLSLFRPLYLSPVLAAQYGEEAQVPMQLYCSCYDSMRLRTWYKTSGTNLTMPLTADQVAIRYEVTTAGDFTMRVVASAGLHGAPPYCPTCLLCGVWY